MEMTESEVKTNVLQAKDQKAQIKICAELNNTCEEEIRDILKAQGVDLRKLKGLNTRHYVKKSAPVSPAPVKESAPTTPIDEIRSRIKSLLMQRDGINSELADLKELLNGLISDIEEESR